MPDLTLGATPARLTVWLVDAAPFAGSVTADNPFPTAPELVFDTGTVWPPRSTPSPRPPPGCTLPPTWRRSPSWVRAG